MTTLEQEIEELRKKHANLELDNYKEKLRKKYDQLKTLEGTVEVRIVKTSKTSRFVELIHHVSYEMKTDSWNEGKPEYNYIGKTIRTIVIHEAPRKPYKKYQIETEEITPDSYSGKIYVKEETGSYSFATYKTVSVETFNTIWNIAKVVSANILDGLLDIKNVKWLMTGSETDHEFQNNNVNDYQKFKLDISHIFLSSEESWKLNNKFTRIFLNKNIYLITPNSLLALDEWYKDEIKQDSWAYSACASVGENWRGSRIDEYKDLINKIKAV